MPDAEKLLRRAYQAFNRRDVEGALPLMHPQVDWPNMIEGGRLRGRAAVREYWRRQFETLRPQVEPRRFTVQADGRILVDVHQTVPDLDGNLVADQDVGHLYALRDGLIERMDVIEPPSAGTAGG